MSRYLLILCFASSFTYAEFDCPENTIKQGNPPPISNQVKCVDSEGLQDGPFWMWYGNGQLMQSLHFKHGKEHGKQQAWFPNGNPMMEGVSIEGKRYQGFKYFNYNGEPVTLEFTTIDETIKAK